MAKGRTVAATDDHKEGTARRKPVSTRLTLGAEDAWRSWRDLPADEPSAAPPHEDGADIPEFSGSMMVVALPDSEPPEAAPADRPAAGTETPDVSPRRARESASPPESPTEQVTLPAPAGGDGEEDDESEAARRQPAAETPPPRRGRPPARREAPARPAPKTSQLPIFDLVSDDRSPAPRSKGTPRRTADEEVYVLDSELDDDHDRPSQPDPHPRSQPGSSRSRRTALDRTHRRIPTEEGSISGLVAEAVAMLEERVARQQAETEELLAGMERQHASELARLDSWLAEKVADARQFPDGFEDRVYASFMEIVERIERIEARALDTPAPVTRSEPDDEQARAAAGAATAYLAEQHEELSERHEQLAAEHSELVHRHRELEARYEALVDGNQERSADLEALVAQQIQLADGQRRLAEAHRHNSEQNASQISEMFTRIEAINNAIDQRLGEIPALEKRIGGMEAVVDERIAGLRSQVDDLASRFPLVAEAADRAVRAEESVGELQRVVDALRTGVDSEIGEIRTKMDELDTLRDQTRLLAEQGKRLHAELELQQAEQDRRFTKHESRILVVEDLIGGEAGVDRQLLLDRMEEIERGLAELDPKELCRKDELAALRAELDGRHES